ncbi:uncharacterized protein PG986_013279 [Apiospora aurea]|uniref:Ricin B lectin domain-containing protein n=1 Tax=Apiospora aurea TaxID=335848 RepID=A0ABR1PV49_9PEZI
MVAKYSAAAFAAMSTLVAAGPVSYYPRAVTELNQAAFEEAQKRDDTATRAFSNTAIKTSDGKCLFVDKLSGDFRANLTPVQVAECGSTDGQGWDIITQGEHNNVAGNMLVVNTLTQACLNFDPRRPAGSQVNLFSCGGRADGGGLVTNSQLFAFDGAAGPLSLIPDSRKGSCLVVSGSTVDVAACDDGKTGQKFTFAGAATRSTTGAAPIASSLTQPASRTSVTVTVTAGELKMKRNAGPDTTTTTELVYVTQRPTEAAEPSFSSTTTIFVTVDASPSAPAQGQPGNIPQVSINPTTTVVLNPGNGAGAQPAPTGAKEAPAASAPAGGAAGGIPQVSINPTTTVVLNPGNGAGAAPARTSVGAGAGKAASSTSAKAKIPASSAPVASAPAGQPIQVSIGPSATVTLNPGNGAAPAATSSAGKAAPTSGKAAAPAPSAPVASAPAGAQPIQVSIGPSGTVTLNPGNGAAPAPTGSAGAGAGAGKAKAPAAPAPSAPAAAPPAGQPIPQVSINPTTTVTLLT